MAAVRAMITAVRNARAEAGFTPKDHLKLYVQTETARDANFFTEYGYLLTGLARLDELVVNGTPPPGARLDVVESFPIAIELPKKVVTPEEIERTRRELDKSMKELESVDVRLANEQFVNNAPPAVVEGARSRRTELVARIDKLRQNLMKGQ
jgi:valyl-tRNA synthetase